MRSQDFRNTKRTYQKKTLAWKIRRALVEGIGPGYDSNLAEVKRYERLIRDHTHFEKPERVNMLSSLLGDQARKPDMLIDLLAQVAPEGNKSLWNKEDKSAFPAEMKKEGVVVASQASDIAELVHELVDLPENKVLHSSLEIFQEGVDYDKKIDQHRRIKLNGAAAIKAFAASRSLEVPISSGGRITNTVYQFLQQEGYGFVDALAAGCSVAQSRPNMDFVTFVVGRPDGNLTYIFPKDLIEGTELFYEFMIHRGGQAHMRHGRANPEEFKYHGENTVYVPRRRPTSKKAFDQVLFKYLPQLTRSRDMYLEWFGTEMICDCDYSMNFRNREDRTGTQMMRYAQICDIHPRAALLWISSSLGQFENPGIVHPTQEAVTLMDKLRYNWHNTKGNGQRVLNRVFNEAIKLFGYDFAFQSQIPNRTQVLKPLYTCLQK